MSAIAIIGIIVCFLIIGKILYPTGEALMESDYPASFPKIVNFTFYLFGAILRTAGLIFYRLAVVLGCAYVLRELL